MDQRSGEEKEVAINRSMGGVIQLVTMHEGRITRKWIRMCGTGTWPLGSLPVSSLKSRGGTWTGPLCFVGMGPFGMSGGWKFRCRTVAGPEIRSLFLVEPSSFGVKKQSVSIRKTSQITQWIDPKCMLFNTSCFKNLLLT